MNGSSNASLEQLRKFAYYRENPWAFVTKCCFSKDQTNKKTPVALLPDWEYLELYSQIWSKYRLMAVPKSRRMTMSWTNIALYLHDTIFNPVRDQAFVSKKEDDAGELVKRAEFMFDNIPESEIPRFLLPKKETRAKPQALIFPELQSKIQGFPMGADQLRQFTFSGILGDEAAFWEEFTKFYAAAVPTIEGGGRMTLISSRSPGGFQRLVYDQLDNQDPIDESVTPTQGRPFGDDSVITWVNPKNNFFIFDVHYTANPLKRDPLFKERIRNLMPIKDYMVEYERNWEAFDGKPVFEDYNKLRHEVRYRLEPELGLPLLIGWDFGLTPAAVVCQLQGQRLIVLKEFVSQNKGIDRFFPEVMTKLAQLYPGWRDNRTDYIHFIDPNGLAKRDTDERTCAMIMGQHGAKRIFPGPIAWEPRRKGVEDFLLRHTKDGAGLQLYAPDAPYLSRGFAGGYQYPEKYAQLEPGKPRPLKNEYSHPHDALQYVAAGACALLKSGGRLEKSIPTPNYAFQGTQGEPISDHGGRNE